MAEHGSDADWVRRFADDVIAESERRAPGKAVVVASGLSPSGPIHLGNLREVMVPHFVADEIRRRGRACVHILSWDDYDRFRRVPAGVDPSWSEHVGKPLTSVPAPPGSPHPNWADHFKAPTAQVLDRLGVEYVSISQTERYTDGAYTEQVLLAMRERARIDDILGRYRTKEGSGRNLEDDGEGTAGYYPYRPYCEVCGRDATTVTEYDDATSALAYRCQYGHAGSLDLAGPASGKLVWKVDWPMRWAYEGVVFEPSGVDHQSPGSSFDVGGTIVAEIFGGMQPIGPMYAFVGIQGMAKMSSSKGGVPTGADALEIMEEPLLRWLYARRRPQQSFTIAFDQEIQRLYDEWDALERKVAGGTASEAEARTHDRAVRTASAELPRTPRPLPYRTLVSVADITTGHPEQILRILNDLDPARPLGSLDEARPRLDRAQNWVRTQMPDSERTHLRTEPDHAALVALPSAERESLRLLTDGLATHWSLDGLTELVYGVPKLMAGLSADAAPTPELKAAQRQFFKLVYSLLIGRDTGPRLPTLLLAAGQDRVRTLLSGD